MKAIRVTMKNTESGRHAGFGKTGQYHCLVGHHYDVPADLAKAWIRDGVAMKATKQAATEKGGISNGYLSARGI